MGRQEVQISILKDASKFSRFAETYAERIGSRLEGGEAYALLLSLKEEGTEARGSQRP